MVKTNTPKKIYDKPFRVGTKVQSTIISSSFLGLSVEVEDGRKGFIRFQDMSYDLVITTDSQESHGSLVETTIVEYDETHDAYFLTDLSSDQMEYRARFQTGDRLTVRVIAKTEWSYSCLDERRLIRGSLIAKNSIDENLANRPLPALDGPTALTIGDLVEVVIVELEAPLGGIFALADIG